jgi:hypothetical protein
MVVGQVGMLLLLYHAFFSWMTNFSIRLLFLVSLENVRHFG